MKKIRRIGAWLLATAVLLGCFPPGVSAVESAKDDFSLVPVSGTTSSADPEGAWLFTTPEPMTAEAVVGRLHIDNQPPVEVIQIGEREFTIIPTIPLSSNTLYRFRFQAEGQDARTWVFQTGRRFRISSVFPAQSAVGVPVNSGIEITFSEDIFAQESHVDMADYFEISPAVSGSFEYHKDTAVFMPEKLDDGTVYTVTVRGGITSLVSGRSIEEDTVFSFETAQKQEENEEEDVSLWFSSVYEELPSTRPAGVDCYIYDSERQTASPSVSVYTFASDNEAVETVRKLQEIPYWSCVRSGDAQVIDTSKMERVMEFTPEALPTCESVRITLPEKLSQGFYLLEMNYRDAVERMVIQISDLPVQVVADDKKTLVWVNSSKTGKPVSDARVTDPESGKDCLSDENGIAVLERSGSAVSCLEITTKEDRCIWIAEDYGDRDLSYQGRGDRDDYWTVLQLDRTLFQKSDTLNLWGFARARDGAAEVDAVTAVVCRGYWWGGSREILQKEVFSVENGVYTGSIQLPALGAGSYCITVYKDNYDEENGVVLGQSYFEVQEYQKPSYTLENSADKTAVFAGDAVQFSAKAGFFEGTPVPELDVSYRVWNSDGQNVVQGRGVTNESGVFTLETTAPTASEEFVGLSTNMNFEAEATLPELGRISDFSSVRVFQRDVAMKAEAEQEKGKAKVKVKLNRVDLERLNDKTAVSYDDYLGEAAVDRQVQAEVYRTYWEEIKEGTYYDYIEKKTRPRYRYEQREQRIKTFTVTTNGEGEAEQEFTLPNRSDEDYYVKLTCTDFAGRTVTKKQYLWTNHWRYSPYEQNNYYLEGTKDSYGLDDEISVSLRRGAETVRTGKTLFVTAQRGILDYRAEGNTYHGTFSAENVPNVYLYAYYFDGACYQSGYSMYHNLRFDYEDNGLQLTVQPDRESYLPGDACNLVISAADKDGNPKLADINISVVDEALLKLQDYEVHTPEELYRSVASGIVVSKATHRTAAGYNHEEGDTAGGGSAGAALKNAASAEMAVADAAEDAGAVRSDFRDTAQFAAVTTDADGNAVYRFTLPDNITAWRITLTGISRDLLAGNLTRSISVSQPMFLNYTLNNTFLIGDIPVVGVNAYGDGLAKGEKVMFTVWDAANPAQKWTVEGTAYTRSDIPLWEMTAAGDYSLMIQAAAESGKTDTVEHRYRVIDGHRRKETAVYSDAVPGMRFDVSQTGLSQIVFTDRGRGQYLDRLLGLCYVDGDRIEKHATARAAAELVEEYFPELEYEFEDAFDPAAYQQEDGGIAILPYAESDLGLTVKLMPLLAKEWDPGRLRDYLYAQYESEDKSKTKALYGLAMLEEPVLDDLEAYMGLADMSAEDAVYLALAYMALGDTETASVIYDRYLSDQLEYAEPYCLVNAGTNRDDVLELTSAAAQLAARLGRPEHEGMYRYCVQNHPEDVLIGLEQVAYIRRELANKTPESGAVTYRYLDETYTKELSGGSFVLKVPNQNIGGLEILEVNGGVGVVSCQERALDAETEQDQRITVKRRYYKVGSDESSTHFRQGDLVRVNLWIDYSDMAMDGSYTVTDYLPAGLAYVDGSAKMDEKETGDFGRGYLRYCSIDGQKVQFYDWNCRFYTGRLYYYYARVISPGTFTAEGTLVQSLTAKDSLTWGENALLTIE